MNCAELHDLLADYLAGEASADTVAAVREHLAVCPACRDQVAGLQAAAAVLESGLPTVEQAETAVACLGIPSPSRSARDARRGALWPALRYAAVIVVSFTAGFLARLDVPSGPASRQVADGPTPSRPTTVSQSLAERLATHPQGDRFSQALLAIAKQ